MNDDMDREGQWSVANSGGRRWGLLDWGRRGMKQEQTGRIMTERPFTKYPAHSLAGPAFASPGARGSNSITTPYRGSWSAARNVRTKSRKRKRKRKNRKKKGWLLDTQWLCISILRSCERGKAFFDRALFDRTRLVVIVVRDKQRTGSDDGQRGDDNTFPRRRPPVSFLASGTTSRYSGKHLVSPIVGVLPAGRATTSSPRVTRPTSCS